MKNFVSAKKKEYIRMVRVFTEAAGAALSRRGVAEVGGA